jgi:hypothetical protein
MSTTRFSFKARLKVGAQIIPLASEIVAGSGDAKDGVENGFLFKLDRQPGDSPVYINLGDIIGFIENSLGAGSGSLSKNPNLKLLQDAFPDYINGGSPFTSGNGTQIQIQSFELNSTTKSFLFSFSVDLLDADPNQGLISLPAELASWIQIKNLAISFSATSKS